MNKPLPEICKIQYGYAFDSASFSNSQGVPLIRIRDVVRGYSETYTTEEAGDEYIVNNGDMLIGMDGEFNIAHWKGGKAYLNQRVCKLMPTDEVDALYLFYFMPKALKAIEDKTPFVTVKHLSAKELNKVVIPMPSLEEQRKIAGSLQKVDELITLRKEQLTKLDRLVKSRFIELFGDVKTNKFGWEKCRFGDVATKITDGEHGTVPRVEKGESYLYFMARNITKDGNIDLTETSYVPEEVHRKIYKRCNPETGDILLVCVGATIGKCTIVPKDFEEFSMARSVALIKPDRQKVNSTFLISLLKSDAIQNDISNCAHAAAQAGLYTNMIINLDAFLPPIELQNQFAAFVEQTDKSKLAIQQSLDKLETLKKSLMQEYFG